MSNRDKGGLLPRWINTDFHIKIHAKISSSSVRVQEEQSTSVKPLDEKKRTDR
jgi:hypothetical protein